MNFSKFLKLIILAPILGLMIHVPLSFIVSKIDICRDDVSGICRGGVLTFLFIVAIIVITGFLEEKILEKKSKRYEDNLGRIVLSKVFTYLVIAPLVIFLTFFLLYIKQKILYNF